MRPEKISKVTAVAYVLSGIVSHLEDIDSDNQIRIDSMLKRQELLAEENIRNSQKTMVTKEDGYFVSAGVVYKVYHTNTFVKRITGDEARNVKRLVKQSLAEKEAKEHEEELRIARELRDARRIKAEMFVSA